MMHDTADYKHLLKAANRKNNTEIKIYRNMMTCVDNIINQNTQYDALELLRSLRAYSESRIQNNWFTALAQITYALLIGGISILASYFIATQKTISLYYIPLLTGGLLIAAFFVWHGISYDTDFKRTMIVQVLNDKIDSIQAMNKHRQCNILGINDLSIKVHYIAYKSNGTLLIKFRILNETTKKIKTISKFRVTVTNTNNNVVASYSQNEFKANVLPNSSKDYSITIKGSAILDTNGDLRNSIINIDGGKVSSD